MSGDLSTGPGLPTPGHAEFEELAVGHALDALEPADEQRLLGHLPRCARCRDALVHHGETAAALAFAAEPVAQPEPGALLAEIFATAVAPFPEAMRVDLRLEIPATRGGGPEARVEPTVIVASPRRVRARAAGMRHPRVLLGSGALAIAGITLGAVLGIQQIRDIEHSGGADPTQVALQIFADPHATTGRLVPSFGDSGSGASVMAVGHTVLVVDGLPRTDGNSHYVVWRVGAAGTKPVALTSFGISGDKAKAIDLGAAPANAVKGPPQLAVSLESGPVNAPLPTTESSAVLLPGSS